MAFALRQRERLLRSPQRERRDNVVTMRSAASAVRGPRTWLELMNLRARRTSYGAQPRATGAPPWTGQP